VYENVLTQKIDKWLLQETVGVTMNSSMPPGSPIQRADFFKRILDSLQIGVIIIDATGSIIYINNTYARFLGIDPQAEIGKHATEVVANTRLHIVAKTGQMEINYPHQFKEHGFLVHRVPIKEDDQVIAVVGLILFDSASTASRLAEKVSFLESKVHLYENELLSLRSTRYTMDSIVGVSKSLTALKWQAMKAAATSLPVVIVGESGTGKELFAQAIHNASPRKFCPFVRVNCSAIPRELFESELFGYDRGAFTGAKAAGKPGRIELAHHGSLFLDEIGDLPLEMQPKLLRVLEEKDFERVGGTKLVKSDFRLLAATNQNLEDMMVEKRFRTDLFYRLNVITLQIPPLRERREDILPIGTYLLKLIAQDCGMRDVSISPAAADFLLNYDWPGNVRELSNVLERAVHYAERDHIELTELPRYVFKKDKDFDSPAPEPLKSVQNAAENDAMRRALEATGFNKTRAAQMLGIHRSLFYKKLKKHGLALQPGRAVRRGS
jgi:transcriptional regulator with PAS, ATPase and Fis domain